MIKSIEDLDLTGKRLFIRVDFNVPLDDNGKVADDTRIRESLPTIKYAIANGARVVLASHFGRPKGKRVPEMSLMPAAEKLRDLLGKEVIFADDCVGDGVRKLVFDLRNGGVLLLENLRYHKDEEGNEASFSKKLAELCDVYVNDAFGCAHRAHASTVGMVEHVAEVGAGYLMMKEIEALTKVLEKPEHPFVVLLGGAKVSDKIGVIRNLLDKADSVLIGGGMAYPFLKLKGVNVGKSLVEEGTRAEALKILEKVEVKKLNFVLPIDHVTAMSTDADKGSVVTEIGESHMGLDIGPETIEMYLKEICAAKTVFWNGPMGLFENPAFASGTAEIAKALNDSKAFTVVGGGDSVAAIKQFGAESNIGHISTGGGASLEFMEGQKLPGIAALDR